MKNPFLNQTPQTPQTPESISVQNQKSEGGPKIPEILDVPQPQQSQFQQPQQMVPYQSQQFQAQDEGDDSGILDISFDSDVKINKLERLPKMNKDEVARIAFILFDANNAPIIKLAHSFFHKPTGTSFLAPTNKDVLAKTAKAIGEPGKKFGTVVLKYSTDQFGNILNYDNLGFDLFAFIFSTDKFPVLRQMHREWGLVEHDVLLACSDLQFQKMAMQPTRESLWRMLPQEKQDTIVTRAKELYDTQLKKQFGKSMSDQEVLVTIGAIQAPMMSQPGMNGGAYNPFGNGMTNNPNMMSQNRQTPFQNGSNSGMMNQGGPAVNLAGQVGTGIPQSGEFSNLIKK